MKTYTLSPLVSAPRVPFNFDGRILYKSQQYELIHLTLQSGETMEPHVQPMDVVFFVVEGLGSLTVGDAILEVQENTTVHIPAGVQRAWKNPGNHTLRILVNKLIA
jgi:mannose-6-phosphate isomerase-like protein (cupin superfamily)